MLEKTLLQKLEEYAKNKKFENISDADSDRYSIFSNFEADYGEISCVEELHRKSDDSIIVKHKMYPNLSKLVEYKPSQN